MTPTYKVDFTVPMRTPTLNKLLGMHWMTRRAFKKQLAWAIVLASPGPPPAPLPRARVTVFRYTTGKLDPDGKQAICKGLLDLLQPLSKRNKMGLGYITNDDDEHLELVVHTINSQAVATRIIVEAIP